MENLFETGFIVVYGMLVRRSEQQMCENKGYTTYCGYLFKGLLLKVL
jgi:hypothetical protein